ncbi:MAG: nickel pincer cofactor biosynthesis protein LarC, partial [Salinigranum sp.]
HSHSHDGDHSHSHDGDHSHSHDGDHAHEHDGDHAHEHAEGAGPHRSYAEVVDVVESMGLSGDVESNALRVFEILAEAEASVHGTDVESTHFHEVGADDAIADIVGACLLFDDLDPDRVVTTPLSAGGGEARMGHGVYPVPAPAVVEIASRASWSLRGGPVESELLTPTGASILAHFADGVGRLPTVRVRGVGYGAGGHDFPEHPNVLRATVGETRGASAGEADRTAADTGDDRSLVRDEIRVLETNVDDVSPEILGGLQESLSAAGARDVVVIPMTMKKSRPGHLVRVVVRPEDVDRVAHRLATETGTLGIRETGVAHRWIAQRRLRTVELELGDDTYEVAVKVASDAAGEVYDRSAEYDDAAAVAEATGLPTREVMRRAENAVED